MADNEMPTLGIATSVDGEPDVQYYVGLTEEDLEKMNKDPLYVQEVAARAILSTDAVASWTINEHEQHIDEAGPSENCVGELVNGADIEIAPEHNAETEPEHNETGLDGHAFQWPKQAVKELIPIYLSTQSMFQRCAGNHKKVWQAMAEKLHAKGWPKITATQVYSKWRGLKKQYHKIHALGGRASKTRKMWQFYLPMQDALSKDRQDLRELRRRSQMQGEGSVSPGSTCSPPHAVEEGAEDAVMQQGEEEGDSDSAQNPARQRASHRRHGHRSKRMPSWMRKMWEDLGERRKERQVEKEQLMAILKKVSDSL